jgi:DNA repair exonuclease SbcCD ATPase subunit
MSFDYKHTCPDIDRSIKEFKSSIETSLDYMLDACCPLLVGSVQQNLIKEYADQIYNELERCFEDVRTTNGDMRKEADSQMKYEEEKASDAEEEVKDLSAQIEELNTQIEELNEQVSELEESNSVTI